MIYFDEGMTFNTDVLQTRKQYWTNIILKHIEGIYPWSIGLRRGFELRVRFSVAARRSWWIALGQGTFPSLVLLGLLLLLDHEYVICRRDITEVMLKTA